MSDTSLGQEMKVRRGSRSLRHMAEACGGVVGFTTLGRIESGDTEVPSREVLEAISRGYQFPIEYLAQLVYLGHSAADREVTDGTDVLAAPLENEEPCEDQVSEPARKRLAVI